MLNQLNKNSISCKMTLSTKKTVSTSSNIYQTMQQKNSYITTNNHIA